jgi:U4/U6.U5 tri-snRNP component SNU23
LCLFFFFVLENGHTGAVVVRTALKEREQVVDLYSRLGKSSVITNTTPLAGRGGYFCETCECLLKDSMSYLDHINGKRRKSTINNQQIEISYLYI